jgi:TetR/AcrR family transcriptional regulator of autoinduction and epiphytic fitness
MGGRRQRTRAIERHGRIDGRTARQLDSRKRITAAIIELVRRGVLDPTADQVAAETGLSRALVFRYFRDKESLRRPVIAELEGYSRRLMGEGISPALPLAQRLEIFLERHCRMQEAISPFRRATLLQEPFSREIANAMNRARRATRKMIENLLGSELDSMKAGEQRILLDALHMVIAWPSWETLRRHYGRTVAESRRIVTTVTLLILHDAIARTKRQHPL